MAMSTQMPYQFTSSLSHSLSLVHPSLSLYTLSHTQARKRKKKEKGRRGGLELQQQEEAMEIT
jgi:hypothetical protein